MAKKGEASKSQLTEAILKLYPDNAFTYDKNIYVNFIEGGEKVQLKIALTMPKTPIEIATNVDSSTNWDWSDNAVNEPTPIAKAEPAEITDEEVTNVQVLLKRLGL